MWLLLCKTLVLYKVTVLKVIEFRCLIAGEEVGVTVLNTEYIVVHIKPLNQVTQSLRRRGEMTILCLSLGPS